MRSKRIARINLDPPHYIDVSVSYSGKPDYCGAPQQGYYLHVQPIINKGDGKVALRTGYKARIEEATRYSAKRLEALASTALDTDLCKQLLERVRTEVLGRMMQ